LKSVTQKNEGVHCGSTGIFERLEKVYFWGLYSISPGVMIPFQNIFKGKEYIRNEERKSEEVSQTC
jgi:hypothetical protein